MQCMIKFLFKCNINTYNLEIWKKSNYPKLLDKKENNINYNREQFIINSKSHSDFQLQQFTCTLFIKLGVVLASLGFFKMSTIPEPIKKSSNLH